MNFKGFKPLVRRSYTDQYRYFNREEMNQRFMWGFIAGVGASLAVVEVVLWVA